MHAALRCQAHNAALPRPALTTQRSRTGRHPRLRTSSTRPIASSCAPVRSLVRVTSRLQLCWPSRFPALPEPLSSRAPLLAGMGATQVYLRGMASRAGGPATYRSLLGGNYKPSDNVLFTHIASDAVMGGRTHSLVQVHSRPCFPLYADIDLQAPAYCGVWLAAKVVPAMLKALQPFFPACRSPA